MEHDFIPVNRPLLSSEDAEYVRLAISEGWISGEGKYIQEFEAEFANSTSRKYAISVANGTVALDLVFASLNLGPGDEVILPSFTIISCLNQILRSGATPIFVDADSSTWNMDVSAIEGLISDRTKAILAVHIYGLPVNMQPLVEICQKYEIPLIEDAAEAHGLKYEGRVAGSFGMFSTFSFYANKNITTGEGGMILTDDDDLAQKIRTLRNLGFSQERRFVHNVLGWNARLSSIQAALGTSQLKRLESIVEQRKSLGARYHEAFKDIPALVMPVVETTHSKNNYWVFGMVLREDAGLSAIEAMTMLASNGIGSRPFFFPLHKQPVLRDFGFEVQPSLPVAEWLGNKGFYIPNGLGITEPEICRVIEVVSSVFR